MVSEAVQKGLIEYDSMSKENRDIRRNNKIRGYMAYVKFDLH